MVKSSYRDQANLLIQTLPSIGLEKCFAMHGGTAINLFLRNMPRLSVDVDLTYLPIEAREETFKNIESALLRIRNDILKKIPRISVRGPFEKPGQAKLFCTLREVQIKIEVNTTMRGSLESPNIKQLCAEAQKEFNQFTELQIMPISHLYGGKICAALDRQHPRDLFDIKYMFSSGGFTSDIKRGFLLCLLSSDRPIHEILRPILINQKDTMNQHFDGMTREPFNYEEFEETRSQLITTTNTSLTTEERKFLIGFNDGNPDWASFNFSEFEKFPAIQWKLQNIQLLKTKNAQKHSKQLDLLKKQLQ